MAKRFLSARRNEGLCRRGREGLQLSHHPPRNPAPLEAKMTIVKARRLACGIAILGAFGSARSLHAQIGVGTWVRQSTASMLGMTMVVEACCNGGRRLIYHVVINGSETLLTVESPFDGSDAPVLMAGKPSGETMEIARVDDHHLSAVVRMNGKGFGTSKSTLSADGRTLTVVNDFTSSAGGQAVGKNTEIWVRK